MRVHGQAARLPPRSRARLVVLADRAPPSSAARARGRRRGRTPRDGEVGHGVLDRRGGVLHAEHDLEAPGVALVERRLQRGALGLGAGRQRRQCRRWRRSGAPGRPAARASAAGRGGCRCSTARSSLADARRAVRHEEHADRSGHAGRAVRGCTARRSRPRMAGIGLRQHAVAEVEDVARVGRPLSASTSSVAASATSSHGRGTSAGSRLPCTRGAGAEAPPGLVERRAPVDPDHVGAGRRASAEQLAGADAEVDAGARRMAAASSAKTLAEWGST